MNSYHTYTQPKNEPFIEATKVEQAAMDSRVSEQLAGIGSKRNATSDGMYTQMTHLATAKKFGS